MSPSPSPSPSRLESVVTPRRIFLGITALLAVLVIWFASDVMLPFVLALVIAYVLLPLVMRAQRRGMPRGAAILLVYICVLGGSGIFLRVAAPRLGAEVGALRHELPTLTARLRDEWVPNLQTRLRAAGILPPPAPIAVVPEDAPAIIAHPMPDGSIGVDIGSGVEIQEMRHGGYRVVPVEHEHGFDAQRMVTDAVGQSFAYAQSNALELVRMAQSVVVSISRAIFIFGITLMLAAYLMLTKERILSFFRSLVKRNDRASFDELLARIDRGLSGVVRGQLIICMINGALSAIGFAIIGLKFWPVLAVVATLFSLIPIFGSIASAVPAVLLALTQGVGPAVFVLAWIVGIHQLEANFLNPKIMGDQAKIHPVLVIFALLVGEHWFHAVGALLAVPVMSIAQSVFLHVRERVDAENADVA